MPKRNDNDVKILDKMLKPLSNTIRTEREKMGLSQEGMAWDSEISRRFYGKIENAEINLSFLNIYKIAKTLKMKPSQLLKKAGL